MKLYTKDEVNHYMQEAYTIGQQDFIEYLSETSNNEENYSTEKLSKKEFEEAKIECKEIADKIKNKYKSILKELICSTNHKYIPFFENRRIGNLYIVFNEKFSKNKKKNDVRPIVEKIKAIFQQGTEKYTFNAYYELFKNDYIYADEYERGDDFNCFICNIVIRVYKK